MGKGYMECGCINFLKIGIEKEEGSFMLRDSALSAMTGRDVPALQK
jgi:hypothetical protein